MSHEGKASDKGWGSPGASKKHHYFVDGRSLCGKWLYLGPVVDDDFSKGTGREDCVACWRAYAKSQTKKVTP